MFSCSKSEQVIKQTVASPMIWGTMAPAYMKTQQGYLFVVYSCWYMILLLFVLTTLCYYLLDKDMQCNIDIGNNNLCVSIDQYYLYPLVSSIFHLKVKCMSPVEPNYIKPTGYSRLGWNRIWWLWCGLSNIISAGGVNDTIFWLYQQLVNTIKEFTYSIM